VPPSADPVRRGTNAPAAGTVRVRTRTTRVIRTKTDPDLLDSSLSNEPIHLREWGTSSEHPLPSLYAGDRTIGSASDAWLRLQDAEHFVSRNHALLRYQNQRWMIVDSGSKNGLWIDGFRADSAELLPGIEVGIGRLRLIVESARSVRQRDLLSRLLGWDPERRLVVDRAARVLREFVAARSIAWIAGSDDLVVVARRIHREFVGDESPFVAVELDEKRTLKSAANDARGGTLCVAVRKAPRDWNELRAVNAQRAVPCRVIACTRTSMNPGSIDIPDLASRSNEIARIVDEYAADAIDRLGAQVRSYTDADRALLLLRPPQSLADIEEATLRLIAIREYGGVTSAAQHLGITHSALSRWLARRTVPQRQS
jgi:pSer/pThr/pTyr-binding forkhead associated (FHA) protein